MTDTIKTVACVLLQGKTVLLVKHGKKANHITDTYGLPAGRVNPNESDKIAALRELFEETGLTTEENDLIEIPKEYSAVIERKDGDKKHFSMKAYLVKKFSGTLASTEETIPEWVGLNDLSNLNLLPNVDKAIADAQKI